LATKKRFTFFDRKAETGATVTSFRRQWLNQTRRRKVFKAKSFQTALQKLRKLDRSKEHKNIIAHKKRASFYGFWCSIRELFA
jgi:hypothetical protein